MILCIALFSFAMAMAQAPDSSTTSATRSKLESLRREIQKYRSRVSSETRKEEEILKNLEQFDREIDLLHEFIAELKKEEREKLKIVNRINDEIENKQDELNRLREIYKRRIVSFYKYGRMRDLELLLSSRSLNQTLVLTRYLKLIAETDRRIFNKLKAKKRDIEDKKEKLKRELISHRKIINEKTAESKELA
ncbi:MAG: hypothetical protein D6707_05480, partial [Bacteroidetes bacterium]